MNVTVRLFASYREAVGSALVEIPLEDGAGGKALWAALVARYPALASLPAPSGYAVNDEYAPDPRPFRESDTIALIPPVSGGGDPAGGSRDDGPGADSGGRSPTTEVRDPAGRPALIELTGGPIPVDRVLRDVADPRAGAVVLFLGVVRNNARGRRVKHLTYEAYEAMARRECGKIAAAIQARWPVTRVAIVHRTGRLEVGEASVAIAVSAPHRAAAFEAGRFAIDTLKRTVPIWKKEVWEGGEAWVEDEP